MSEKEAYDVPSGYYYTKDHEWVKSKGPSSFLVGITDYAAKILNDIVYVNLPQEGSSLRLKDVFGQVESVKTVSDMYMPISGKILSTNSKLMQTPELVTNSPYVDGWMLEIESDSFSSESKELMDAKTYADYIAKLKE
ncbi:MAG: glycine cleavage system protein GcvH [Nitrososphaerales archaeon]